MLKICASNSDYFSDIEKILSKLNDEFIGKFDLAEFVLEGNSDVKMVLSGLYDKLIRLPKDFIIVEMRTSEYQVYDKDQDGVIKETPKYQIDIIGRVGEQKLELCYTDLHTPNKTILCCK